MGDPEGSHPPGINIGGIEKGHAEVDGAMDGGDRLDFMSVIFLIVRAC
jgi:hypothetical protein